MTTLLDRTLSRLQGSVAQVGFFVLDPRLYDLAEGEMPRWVKFRPRDPMLVAHAILKQEFARKHAYHAVRSQAGLFRRWHARRAQRFADLAEEHTQRAFALARSEALRALDDLDPFVVVRGQGGHYLEREEEADVLRQIIVGADHLRVHILTSDVDLIAQTTPKDVIARLM